MNLFLLKPLLKAWRGKSLTFSLVFATALLGVSISALLRKALSGFGFWFPLVWLIPIILIGFLAKREDKLPLREDFKRLLCYVLVIGSVVCSFGIWRYRKHMEAKFPDPVEERESGGARSSGSGRFAD